MTQVAIGTISAGIDVQVARPAIVSWCADAGFLVAVLADQIIHVKSLRVPQMVVRVSTARVAVGAILSNPVLALWTARHTYAKVQTVIVDCLATTRERPILAPHTVVQKLVRQKAANLTIVNAENTAQKLEGHVEHLSHATAEAIAVVIANYLALSIPNRNVEELCVATAEDPDVLIFGHGKFATISVQELLRDPVVAQAGVLAEEQIAVVGTGATMVLAGVRVEPIVPQEVAGQVPIVAVGTTAITKVNNAPAQRSPVGVEETIALVGNVIAGQDTLVEELLTANPVIARELTVPAALTARKMVGHALAQYAADPGSQRAKAGVEQFTGNLSPLCCTVENAGQG